MRSKVPYSLQNPFRSVRPKTDKIIFLSCEGSVTEEEYFYLVSKTYSAVSCQIQFISVAEDDVLTAPRARTPEQLMKIGKGRPIQLVERIDQFKHDKDNIYQFDLHPDDEFWIITDVDQNWSNQVIDKLTGRTYKDEWDDAIAQCHAKGYNYAISNPFFEVWLLLHHDDPSTLDKSFAVTKEHDYSKTDHFRRRLETLGVPLKEKKHIDPYHYDDSKIRKAVFRAESLHLDKTDLCPLYFATTVYRLIKKVIDLI